MQSSSKRRARQAGGRLAARYLGDEGSDGRRRIDFELELPGSLFVQERGAGARPAGQ
ncbi:MAG: hypothetical protein KC731_10420 [Myxococcales bacterium]|nr:hypothetical protein [Myxococcales bacterium]